MSAYKLGDKPGAQVLRQRVQATAEKQRTMRPYRLPVVIEILLAIICDAFCEMRQPAVFIPLLLAAGGALVCFVAWLLAHWGVRL